VAQQRAETLEHECIRLTQTIGAQTARHRLPAERLAKRARTTAFSPSARLALDGLTRLARVDALLGLIVPPGVDAQGFAAHVHLESPRADGPFVTIDGTDPETRELALWQDSQRSPLVAADGGTLLVLSASVLPRDVQEHLVQFLVARAHSEPASGVRRAGLVLGLPSAASALHSAGRLHEALSHRLEGRELELPKLVERAEDLRALVLEGLIHLRVGTQGEPLGIEPAALAILAEHDFPGNELELMGILTRTAARATGTRISAQDLLDSGLGSEPAAGVVATAEDPTLTPPPSLAVRRRSLRRAPGR
jgi:DNA-binding NtrC family response regulator